MAFTQGLTPQLAQELSTILAVVIVELLIRGSYREYASFGE